jgi:hypothetical protein
MPDYNAAVMRGLIEDLVMPETDWTIKQLRRRNDKRRIPQQVVKARLDAPGAKRVKQGS